MDRLQQIEQRMSAIKAELQTDGADIEALEKEVNALKEERKGLLEKAEKRSKIIADIGGGAGNPVPNFMPKESRKAKEMTTEEVLASPEYRTAFLKQLQGKPLTVEEREYVLTPPGNLGSASAAVPIETANMIFDQMIRIAPMLNEIMLMRVAGRLRFAVQGVRNPAVVHVENVAVVPAQDTLITVTLTGYEFMKAISVSATVQTMSIPAFEAWLTKILAEDIALVIDNQIINGGSVSGSIANAQVWANGINQVTYVGQVAYTDLTNLISLLPSAFDANAKFVMSKATFYRQIMNITDANNNIITVPELAAPGKFRILGYPVLIDDNVTIGEAFLGDFRQVVGNLSQDIRVESSADSGFLRNSIDYRGTCIFDCAIAQPNAIVKLNV